MGVARAEISTRGERVAEKERAILAAARAVFVKNGFERARMAEIAKRAGVAEGTIYIYYKTKNDLLQAVVLQFWDGITTSAAKAVDPKTGTFEQLRALADHHLTLMIRDREFIELEVILRNSGTEPIASERTTLKRYVAIFDTIFRRGVDRGDLVSGAPIWIPRDLFYGTLDYSSRTIVLRGARRPTGVVDNLIEVFRACYGRTKDRDAPTTTLVGRLEAAVSKIEKMTKS
ncbi:MAG: TetR/AcrR family transcriptional regulator [Hyphomonadaceae bacterium]|nr:TetR/AcrR family transcriptional regulator [Hyphomonadaceae bacterium]